MFLSFIRPAYHETYESGLQHLEVQGHPIFLEFLLAFDEGELMLEDGGEL